MRRFVVPAILGVLLCVAGVVARQLSWTTALSHLVYVVVAFPAENGRRLLVSLVHPAPGQSPLHGHLSQPFVGWAQWVREGPEYRWTQIHADVSLRAAVHIELVVAGLLLMLLAWKPLWLLVTRVQTLHPSTAHGSARWASRREVVALRPRRAAAPFVLGKVGVRWVGIPAQVQYENALVVGPPGTGKSSGLIIPNLLRERGDGPSVRSLIITDPKGEAWDRTHGAVGRHHTALRLDFTDPSGAGYNPLALISSTLEAQAFAQAWIANTGESSSEPFWDNAALYPISSAILHLLAISAGRRAGPPTLGELADFLTTTTIATVKSDLAHSASAEARQCATGFLLLHGEQ